jgi:hypothetical protein
MGKIRIKRRHTENHPEVFATKNGDIRNEFVKFIGKSGGSVSISEFEAFAKYVKTKLRMSYTPEKYYKTSRYMSVSSGNVCLNRLGKNLYNLVLK